MTACCLWSLDRGPFPASRHVRNDAICMRLSSSDSEAAAGLPSPPMRSAALQISASSYQINRLTASCPPPPPARPQSVSKSRWCPVGTFSVALSFPQLDACLIILTSDLLHRLWCFLLFFVFVLFLLLCYSPSFLADELCMGHADVRCCAV